MDKRKMSQSGATTAAGRMAYEGKVGVEAVVRSGGKNPQLKGVVHENLRKHLRRSLRRLWMSTCR